MLLAAPIVFGGAYSGITFWNKMVKTIEATSKLTALQTDMATMQEQLTSIKENQLNSLQSNIRLQEKASEAIALAREASAISKSTQREVEVTIEASKSEVKTMVQSLEDKVEVLKRATTNPLGN